MFALLLAPAVLAEQEYYTWVDELGRVHNTPISSADKKDSRQASSKNDSNTTSKSKPKSGDKPGFYTWVDEFGRVHNTPVKALDLDNADDYLSEKDYERQAEKDRKDSPEFYTWVDEQGRIHNQAVPQVEVTTTNTEDEYQKNVTDHTLLPPLRLRQDVQNASCCLSYATYFKELLVPLKSRMFSKPQFSNHFYTQSGNKPAWFFKLPTFKLDEKGIDPVLKLRLRNTDKPMAFIALNKNWQPLHSIPQLEPKYFPATWRTVAMYETLISVADEEVYAVIVYFPQGVENTANLEVLWTP